MIARAHRFHGHNSLRFVYSRGEVVRGPVFSLKYARNPKRSQYRAAVVVSRKVHKSAVVRNRIRRRIYEALRVQLAPEVPPYDLVFMVYSDQVAELPAKTFQETVRTQLQKAGVPVRTQSADHAIVEKRS